jgi:hypothetical protein
MLKMKMWKKHWLHKSGLRACTTFIDNLQVQEELIRDISKGKNTENF